jgi:hypothetical protein
VPWNDEIGADQSASGSGETTQECHRNAKGWIRDDAKGPSWQSRIGPVGLHHGHFLPGELPAKIICSSWV